MTSPFLVAVDEVLEEVQTQTRLAIDRVIGERVNALNSIAMAELRDELYKEIG